MTKSRVLRWFSVLAASSLAVMPVFSLADEPRSTGEAGQQVEERAVPQPYTCSQDSGVCLCVGQANCEQLVQPKPCKRPKLCLGGPQSAAQKPPSLGTQVPSSSRTITTNFMVCSCRSAS